jgi:hypothetical protein
MRNTARYTLQKAEDLERIALKRKEEQRLEAMQPIERLLCMNGSKHVDTYAVDGIRMYERKTAHTESIALVYDGRLYQETASQISAASRAHPGMITVFYTTTNTPGKNPGVRGFDPSDMHYFKESYLECENTGNQVSVEIQGFGKLEETVVNQAKNILEKARKITPQKV